MEAVKILECSREGLSGVRGRGTFRWWRRELERPSPAGACCGLARKTPFYNRCGAGKWAVAGRESEAAAVLVEPQGNTTCGEGRAAASFTRELGAADW
jgi:hypothetical protein